ncbi:6299_t:CDS:10, partial [Gigaspora rosea]
DPSHNDVSQLQTDKSPEFLSPGDISQMSFDFNAFVESPEVTNIQPNFDESPELASFIDAPQFQNRFKLTELTNTDGHQIYPEYAYSFHKTNILQVPIKKNVCKVSQVLQQLSNLDLILSENQVMQSQVLSSLNDRLNNLYTNLDSFSSNFSQLLGELKESNLRSSRMANALQDRINQYSAFEPYAVSSISLSSGKLIISTSHLTASFQDLILIIRLISFKIFGPTFFILSIIGEGQCQNWANSQSRTNEVTNINAQEAT